MQHQKAIVKKKVTEGADPLRLCCANPPLPRGEVLVETGYFAALQKSSPLGRAVERMRD